MHATGLYPDWWDGRRFPKPTLGWACGTSNEITRDVVQGILLGDSETDWGTGAIPFANIIKIDKARGMSGAVDKIFVRHVSGGVSVVQFKCFPAGTRVCMASGEWKQIEDVSLGETVLTVGGGEQVVSQLHSYPNAPVVEIATRSGRIRATPNHEMFTARGRVEAGDLKVGDDLEIADLAVDGAEVAPEWEVAWTALMIGDGCLRGKTPFITCAEPGLVAYAERLLPDDLYVAKRPSNDLAYFVSSKLHKKNRLKDALERDGLWNKKSPDKFVPSWVFRLSREQRIQFLFWLWSTDGTISRLCARYVSTSKQLADDVRALLWGVGIHGSVTTRSQPDPKHRDYHYVDLTGFERIRFGEIIGKHGRESDTNIVPRPRGPRGEVLSITECDNETVYCLGVDGPHEFIAEGYRVGNSYEQTWKKFTGAEVHWVWLDEEPDEMIYKECLTRVTNTKGIVYLSLTPLQGATSVVNNFYPSPNTADRHLTMMTIDDALHMDDEMRQKAIDKYQPYEREARLKGIPMLGSGRVFPIPDETIEIDDFKIPEYWPQIVGLDFGYDHPTAATNVAWDRDNDCLYVTNEYRVPEEMPVVHARAISAWGKWKVVAWPHDGHRRYRGGVELAAEYKHEGLRMHHEHATFASGGNGTEAGLMEMLDRMRTGRFKVFASCKMWLGEFHGYHRKDGKVVAERDDLICASRYAMMMRRFARTEQRKIRKAFAADWDPLETPMSA